MDSIYVVGVYDDHSRDLLLYDVLADSALSAVIEVWRDKLELSLLEHNADLDAYILVAYTYEYVISVLKVNIE